jgi:NAD-dependent SIR2 family protein deacetylase
MDSKPQEFARAGRVVVFAGAGVSAGRPSALPGWRQLNEEIVAALRTRLEQAVERKEWLADVVSRVGGQRDAGRFPPDYQAQIIEEMCGDRYFRALQALDVDVVNSGHEGIAALAAGGALRAVVTTNFDRLIERALERRGVAFDVVFDEAGFTRMGARVAAGEPGPLPLIKIHGSVSDHRSMIDVEAAQARTVERAAELPESPIRRVLAVRGFFRGRSGDGR